MSEINPTDVFTHIESGNEICVIAVGSMKIEGGVWYDSVTYRNLNSKNPERVFTRSLDAFNKLFVRGVKG